MKHMKKMFSLLLTLIMVSAMALSVSAATITVNGGAEDSQYAAYKLLNASVSADGSAISYAVNKDYESVLQTVTGKTTNAEIIAYIGTFGNDSAEIRAFADAVYRKIKELDKTADLTTTSNKFTGEEVAPGYYLIAETAKGNSSETYSLVMLDTAKDDTAEVTVKKDKPELEKKVIEKNDSTGYTSKWQDGADYDLGDDVPFRLTGTLPEDYGTYNTYYYAFHDDMSAGLTLKKEEGVPVVKVKVLHADGTETDVAAGNYTVVTEGLTDSCEFEVRFANLKQVTTNATDKIVVYYTATLNENSVIGAAGNPNQAKLEYSNNPYYEGTGSGGSGGEGGEGGGTPGHPGDENTSETPWDGVIVFTYVTQVEKTDEAGNPLAGATFELHKYNAETEAYEAVTGGFTLDKTGTIFTWSRIDAGKYKLTETKAPDGYTQAEDIYFTVEATYDTDAADPAFKTLTITVTDKDGNVLEGKEGVFTVDHTAGSVATTVVNTTGSTLPSTGGRGTTAFYLFGFVLAAGAAVVLVTRKRMSADR